MAAGKDKVVAVPLAEFLDMQDKLANTLTIYRGISMKILEASSNSLSITTDALTNLHSLTTNVLAAADIQPNNAALGPYGTIQQLLKNPKEKIRDFDSLNLPHIAIGEKQKKPKSRKTKDPAAPKRPDTAYLRFANQNREKYADRMKKENPDTTRGEVAKKLTADWNAMDEKAQEPYKESYRKEMSEYAILKAEYEKTTGKKVDEEKENDAEAAAVDIARVAAADSSDDEEGDESSESEPAPEPPKKGAKGKAAAAKKESAATVSPAKPTASPAKPAAAGRKRKSAKDDAEDEASKKKAKKDENAAEETTKGGKKKKAATKAAAVPIDPRLEKADKETKRAKRKSQHGEDY